MEGSRFVLKLLSNNDTVRVGDIPNIKKVGSYYYRVERLNIEGNSVDEVAALSALNEYYRNRDYGKGKMPREISFAFD